MTQEQIEGNKIIAEFMGFPLKSKQILFSNPQKEIEKDRNFKFHSSWDWLIPVCQKLDNLAEDNIIEWSDEYVRWCDILDDVITGTYHIESVFKVVVDFIKWYNQIKQQ